MWPVALGGCRPQHGVPFSCHSQPPGTGLSPLDPSPRHPNWLPGMQSTPTVLAYSNILFPKCTPLPDDPSHAAPSLLITDVSS